MCLRRIVSGVLWMSDVSRTLMLEKSDFAFEMFIEKVIWKKLSGVYQIQAEVIKAWSIKFFLGPYTYYFWWN